MAIQEGHIPVPGGNIWYGIVGADRKGVPLVVVHGGPGAPHDYLEPLAALADDRPIVFYDQLGCGNSDKPDDLSLWTIERFVEELAQLRAALDLARVHLLGQSWGSALVIDYMLTRQPAGIAGLVLSGPLASASRWIADQQAHLRALPEEAQAAVRKAEASGDFESAEYQAAMMQFYRRHVCRLERWPECLDRAFQKLAYPVYLKMWGPSEFSVSGTLKRYDRVDALKDIRVPVLFTCGEHDEATPRTTRLYQRHLPGSAIAVFPGASHEHHLEQPEHYLSAVRDFLAHHA